MRTLDSRQVVVTETVCVHESNGPKQRFLFRGGSPFLSEADGYERSPEFAMGAGRLGGEVPRADLAKNLNAGGIILPKDDK